MLSDERIEQLAIGCFRDSETLFLKPYVDEAIRQACRETDEELKQALAKVLLAFSNPNPTEREHQDVNDASRLLSSLDERWAKATSPRP